MNLKNELTNRIDQSKDDDLQKSKLPISVTRKIKEERQLKKMLQEKSPSEWVKGPEKLDFYNKDGSVKREETNKEWKERQRLEQRLIDLYLEGDVIETPEPTYIKSRDGEIKSDREIAAQN